MGKIIKDPVYGYVEIDEELMEDIVDSACFQRLRNIRQTSYSPLYPASMHNRFIHSIGVYHLGKIAIDALMPSIIKYLDKKLFDELKRIFLLACLLHDVGHAPFSHAGEKFYLNQSPSINDLLKSVVDDNTFQVEIEDRVSNAKEAQPHEIMSAIVALNMFPQYFETVAEKDLFARCITGYTYRVAGVKEDISNCLIELLNSSIIDIDRLDYIIRDAHTIGFQSVSIDYNRLIKALRIVKPEEKHVLAYHKSALSIIENVIYAHDSERKWIQSHPVVLYEHFLIQHAIRKVERHFSNDEDAERLFCYDSLTTAGKVFSNGESIRLLADEDILYNMKNKCDDELVSEFFARNIRRHPVWKLEAEYWVLFEMVLGKDLLEPLEKAFKDIESYTIKNLDIPVINEALIKHCNNRLAELQALEEDLTIGLNSILKWAHCLEEFAGKNKIPFEFVIISANKFKSSFSKEDLEKIRIVFPELDRSPQIKNIASILRADRTTRDNYFYLYYKKTKRKINPRKFAKAFYNVLLQDS
jgi:HD superfamily phosphohydrolases